METSIASGIVHGPSALEPRGPAAHAIMEIDPYDLPEPPGGWVDLFLDDDEEEDAPPTDAAPAPLVGPAAAAATVPDARPLSSREGRAAEGASAPAAKRWLLFPEALVVSAFVLLGALFVGALVLLRAPGESPTPGGSLSAPVEVTDPAAGRARRAGRGAAPASRAGWEATSAAPAGEVELILPGVPAPYDDEPIGRDAPVDPESPPQPNLAPWGGRG